jgi:hypothetical protein
MKSNAPWRSKSFWAVGRSKIVRVAPRKLFELPNLTMPEIVNSPDPVGVMIRTRCPTDRSWSEAVAASTATWSGPDGGVPATVMSWVLSGSHEFPNWGAPPFRITSPVDGSTICTGIDDTDPSAAATPSTPWTSGRTLAGIGVPVVPLPSPAAPGLKAVCGCTTTVVPAYTLPKRSSKLFSAVSVRMNVPAVKPTPSTTASAVRTRRSFRASRLLIVARSIDVSGLQRLQPIEDPLGGRVVHLVDRVPVAEEDHAVGEPGCLRVVRHHHDRLPVVGDGPAEEPQELFARA